MSVKYRGYMVVFVVQTRKRSICRGYKGSLHDTFKMELNVYSFQ